MGARSPKNSDIRKVKIVIMGAIMSQWGGELGFIAKGSVVPGFRHR